LNTREVQCTKVTISALSINSLFLPEIMGRNHYQIPCRQLHYAFEQVLIQRGRLHDNRKHSCRISLWWMKPWMGGRKAVSYTKWIRVSPLHRRIFQVTPEGGLDVTW